MTFVEATFLMAIIITKKKYFITATEQISRVVLPKNGRTRDPGISIMVGRKSLLHPSKVRTTLFVRHQLLYISTSFWCCAFQTLVEILIFNIFHIKKLRKWKKARILQQNFVKKGWLNVFSQKNR